MKFKSKLDTSFRGENSTTAIQNTSFQLEPNKFTSLEVKIWCRVNHLQAQQTPTKSTVVKEIEILLKAQCCIINAVYSIREVSLTCFFNGCRRNRRPEREARNVILLSSRTHTCPRPFESDRLGAGSARLFSGIFSPRAA